MHSGVAVDTSPEEWRRHLLPSEGGLGLVAFSPPLDGGLNVLALALNQGGIAFAPTAENVHRGDYPIRWPVYLVFRRDDVKELYALLQFLLGEEAAASLGKGDLLPVPEPVRRAVLFSLEQLLKIFVDGGGSSPSPCSLFAGVAQLVEHHLAKVDVACSSHVARSISEPPPQEGVLLFMDLRIIGIIFEYLSDDYMTY